VLAVLDTAFKCRISELQCPPLYAVPDLPLRLDVLKHRSPLARGSISWACMPDYLCSPTGSTSFRAKSKGSDNL